MSEERWGRVAVADLANLSTLPCAGCGDPGTVVEIFYEGINGKWLAPDERLHLCSFCVLRLQRILGEVARTSPRWTGETELPLFTAVREGDEV